MLEGVIVFFSGFWPEICWDGLSIGGLIDGLSFGLLLEMPWTGLLSISGLADGLLVVCVLWFVALWCVLIRGPKSIIRPQNLAPSPS